MITSIDNEYVLVFSNLQKRELKVLTYDLKLSSSVIDHKSKWIEHPYKAYDLILFGGKAGIVIKVEKDSVIVVGQ